MKRPLPGVQRFCPLPGLDVLAFDRAEVGTSLISGYMFGQPDPGWQGRVLRNIRYRGHAVALPGLELLQVSPGEVVTAVSGHGTPPAHGVFVEPSCAAALLELPRPPELAHPTTTHPAVLRAFAALRRAVHASGASIDREAAAHRFLALAFRHGDDRPVRRAASSCAHAVARTQAIIHDRFAEPLTLAELARAADLSIFHLCRSFVALVGVPVHRYLQLVRVERAAILLRRGAPLAETAAACGFADQPHLHRTFRGVWGVTPGQYAGPRDRRKNVQAAVPDAPAG